MANLHMMNDDHAVFDMAERTLVRPTNKDMAEAEAFTPAHA
jgi:hypothetical protein